MKVEHIERIQQYRGDGPEERWKPKIPAQESYIDWFYYWEFRETMRAGDPGRLRPAQEGACVRRQALYTHERLAGYWYSAYVRLAAMHRCLEGLRSALLVHPQPMDIQTIRFFLEGFYHYFGSVLDMVAGVGNIVYGFDGKEDRFTSFANKFESTPGQTELEAAAVAKLQEISAIKDYRDHITHRPVFAQVHVENPMEINGRIIVAWDVIIEKDYQLPGPKGQRMWRKVIREILEKRIPGVSVHGLCKEHLRVTEDTCDLLFHCFLNKAPKYLTRNEIKVVRNKYEAPLADSLAHPPDAKFIFYQCRTEEKDQLYMAQWLQPIDKPIEKCINSRCKSPDIVPLFYVSD